MQSATASPQLTFKNNIDAYLRLYNGLPNPPLEQHPAYGAALIKSSRHSAEHFVVYESGKPVALFQILGLKVGFIRVRHILRGPIWLTENPQIRTTVLKKLRATHPPHKATFLLTMLNDPHAYPPPTWLKESGMRQVVTGYGTAELDLKPDMQSLRAGLDGKWRNQLAKAEKSPLQIERSTDAMGLTWLLAFAEHTRQSRKYSGPNAKTLERLCHYLPEDDIFCHIATLNNTPVAGCLTLKHGATATYTTAYADGDARAHAAANGLLWQAIEDVKKSGAHTLDLGGLNTQKAAGLARFKLGTGARPVRLQGTYF